MDLHRQLDLVSEENLNRYPIVVIGAGGIGSQAVTSLSKMGCQNITVYDDDKVEDHNIPNQMYRLQDVGKPKVEALKLLVEELTGYEVDAQPVRYEDQPLKGIVVSAVDSMTVRQQIWDKVRYNIQVPLFIDGRMGGEEMRVYALNPTDPDDVKMYENTLYGDEDSVDIACTARSIIYNTVTIGGFIARQVKAFASDERYPGEIIFDLKTLAIVVN